MHRLDDIQYHPIPSPGHPGLLTSATLKHAVPYCMWHAYSTAQYSTVQYSTVQYSTVQYSTVQYSTVQYSTVQYSTDIDIDIESCFEVHKTTVLLATSHQQ